MQIRSKLDGTILNAELTGAPEDTNYGSLVLMAKTAEGRISINMVEAQRDYELLSASPTERDQLEEEGYFLAPLGRTETAQR